MPTIHLLHGIRDNGDRTTREMGALLSREGWEVKVHRFPTTHTWNAWHRRDTLLMAEIVRATLAEGDHLVCHSHGCGVAYRLLRVLKDLQGPSLGGVVMLAPALNRKQDWRNLPFDRLLCVHNPVDFAIISGSLLPFHPFGLAGAYGFRTRDKRIRNRARLSFEGPFNHTAPYFREPYVEDLALEIDAFLAGEARLPAHANCGGA